MAGIDARTCAWTPGSSTLTNSSRSQPRGTGTRELGGQQVIADGDAVVTAGAPSREVHP